MWRAVTGAATIFGNGTPGSATLLTGTLNVGATGNGTVNVQQKFHVHYKDHPLATNCVAFSPEGDRLLSCGVRSGAVKVWDINRKP
jgi:WD40 repeat protein